MTDEPTKYVLQDKQLEDIRKMVTKLWSCAWQIGYADSTPIEKLDGSFLGETVPTLYDPTEFMDELKALLPVSDLSRENQVVSENLKQQIDDLAQEYGALQFQRGFKDALQNPNGDKLIPRDKELDNSFVESILELIQPKGGDNEC